MGKPIKVSDAMYERLKAKAEKEGGTLQAALFSLMEDRAEEMARFAREIAALGERLAPVVDTVGRLAARLTTVEAGLSGERASIRSLSDLRRKDTEAFNSWVKIWERVGPLEDSVEALDKRLGRIEMKAHEHFWR